MTETHSPALPPLFSLAGKVAVITGGSRGLGKEMASALAEAGAKVAISARREQWLTPTADEVRAAGHDCLAATCDISKEDDVHQFVDTVIAHYGRIDILVNNAGISWGAPSLDMPPDRFRQVLDTNTTGTFLMTQAVAKAALAGLEGRASAASEDPENSARGSGGAQRPPGPGDHPLLKIINISSVMGLRATPPSVLSAAGYSASKGALIALTKALAVEWAPHGITVNALAPGFFPTRLSEGVIEHHADELLDRIPLKRFGAEADIRGAITFLTSAASDYITGHVLVLDGGMTAL